MKAEVAVKLLLRVGGGTCLLAVVAVVMPSSWMAAVHERLGMGPLPEGAVVEYLARSLSAMYALLGGLMVLLAGDVRRYAGAITYVAAGHVLLAAVVTAAALTSGMPWYWAAGEGSSGAAFGAALLLLQARARGGRTGEKR